MIDIILLNRHWGSIDLHISFNRIDLLPRITLSDITGVFVMNVGFLMLNLNLVIYDREFREFNRRAEKERDSEEQ